MPATTCRARSASMRKDIVFATWSAELEADSQPFEHEVQAPAQRRNDQTGLNFVSRDDIQWQTRISSFGDKPEYQEAFLRTDLVNDFVRGKLRFYLSARSSKIKRPRSLDNAGEADLYKTDFTTANQQKPRSSAADFGKVQKNSFLVKLSLQCSFSKYRSQKLANSRVCNPKTS